VREGQRAAGRERQALGSGQCVDVVARPRPVVLRLLGSLTLGTVCWGHSHSKPHSLLRLRPLPAHALLPAPDSRCRPRRGDGPTDRPTDPAARRRVADDIDFVYFGASFIRGMDVAFDPDGQRMGFAHSNCGAR
jgi:hypothetical protein